jgi:hypothetical protein
MVSDVARVIVNLIKNAFSDFQYLMCWFHLKMNARKQKPYTVKYRRILSEKN